MIRINFSIRPFIKPNGQVAIRTRWNAKRNEVCFITGFYADPMKWDEDGHKAKRGTTHIVRGKTYRASEINESISDFRQVIEITFEKFSMCNRVPTTDELKKQVNKSLGRNKEEKTPEVVVKKRTMKQMIDWFLEECGREKNWDFQAKEKYTQAFQHLTKANPGIRPDHITLEHMYKLKDWYIDNNYRNRTINKQVAMLKGFLKWIDTKEGYTIPSAVLRFKTNLKVLPKTVTFLNYDELLFFTHYNFENDNSGRLTRARDAWAFMAYTSLRISDLLQLSTAHICNDHIEKYAQKTGEHLYIPLTEEALAILDRYKDTADSRNGLIFPLPSAEKLNEAIKDAAKEAGLNRIITEVYYIGTKRLEESRPFYKIISCHDARRTFVCCSLGMGITPESIMKCTGHKNYTTMKPYVATATETQILNMEKWNKNQYRSKIINQLDEADEEFLKELLADIQAKKAEKVKEGNIKKDK